MTPFHSGRTSLRKKTVCERWFSSSTVPKRRSIGLNESQWNVENHRYMGCIGTVEVVSYQQDGLIEDCRYE